MERLDDAHLSLVVEYLGEPEWTDDRSVRPRFRAILYFSQVCRQSYNWFWLWWHNDMDTAFYT